MLCISRYTDESYAQHYADRRHKFYLEFRCNRPCIKNVDICAKCAEKTDTAVQTSRKFNHGKINEPIPDTSHIFGGKWYHENLIKWGAPPAEVIEFAMKYQKDARGDIVVEQPSYEDITPKKKATTSAGGRTRKPKIAPEPMAALVDASLAVAAAAAPVKKGRKPKIADDSGSEGSDDKKSRKKIIDNPYNTIVSARNKMVYKEVTLPTHIEREIEDIDTDGYDIEYVKLTTFDVGQATYFRDPKKNKLYKKIKENGIGSYIGRWNPETETIITDIPDSDDERE
jgi:hypothetical protein